MNLPESVMGGHMWDLWHMLNCGPVRMRVLNFRARHAVRALQRRGLARVDKHGWVHQARDKII